MISNKEKIIAITVVVFLLIGIVSSEEDNFFLNQVKKIPEYFINFLSWILVLTIEFTITHLKSMILWNPNPDNIKPMVDDFIQIMIPIYVMVMTIIGIYIIFLSISPSGRARAKSMFWKTFLSMVLVSVSLEIFKILLDISEALAGRMLAGVVTVRLPSFILILALNPQTFFIMYLFLALFLILALLVVALRYLMVLLLCAVFPFTLFLYFFEFTKDIGAKLLRYTIMAIYIQVVQALMLAITVISMNSIGMTDSTTSENLVYIFLLMAGNAMIILAPLIMMGIMKWIGGALAGIGMVVSFINPAIGGIMVAAGGVAAGMGPGGLIAGGTAYGLGRSFKKVTPKP